MTREVVDHARLWCDGCGVAVIESVADDLHAAAGRAGWHIQVDASTGERDDTCPVCRPDSPFTQVQRVRELCARFIQEDAKDLTYGADTYTRAWVAHDILDALEGPQKPETP